MQSEDEVRRYYDLNTRRFLRFGHASRVSVIHRSIRHPDLEDPFRVQEQLLLQILRRYRVGTVVDLGCGVGASLLWLSRRHPARYLGITLSPIQAELAHRAIGSASIEIRQGSYLDRRLYTGIERDEQPLMFYGIESWLHCASPEQYMERIAENTRTGDLLAIWDDFPEGDEPRAPWSLWEDFRRGWHALNTLSPGETDRLASGYGLELISDSDLTSHLDIDRPRDYLTGLIVALLRPFGLNGAWWQNLRGGSALRRLLKSGQMSYRLRLWRRS